MAEAVAVVALAGNVIQFLDAGGKFAARAIEICRHPPTSQDGPSNVKRLRQVSTDFQALYEKLQSPASSSRRSRPIELASLSTDCSDVIREVLQKLSSIGIDDTHKRTNLILAEFKAAWNRRDIQELEGRIVALREQLAAHLIVALRDLATESLAQQDVILSEIAALRKETQDSKKGGGVRTGGAVHAPGEIFVTSLFDHLEEEHEQHELGLLMTTLQRKLESFHARRVEAPPEPLADIQVPIARRVQVQKDFILTLNYKEREYRESAISSPYDKTFQWMFNDDPNRKNAEFSQWLASDSSLFWITGKPGSGKSTLMKYISDFKSEGEGAALCRQQLLAWAGSSELLTASFYFWASGSAAQGSQKAMLSSLLFQLLQDNPDIIARIAPAVWESACLFNTQIRKVWTEEDLSEILLNAVKQLSGRKLKTCFFIDGLDEFDGKPETLISFIHRIVELPNVKVCVSSRPWVQFEDAFGRKPSLRVQDLTYGDIKHFVESQFDRNEGFRRLKSREAKYAQSLTHQIVDKSAGVFLWVRIVVQSLLAGLTNDDRVRDLESRLHSLPPDLEQLYDKILDDLDPFYFDHACQYFQLMLVHNGPTRALLLSFADEEDVDFPNRLPVRALRRHKAAARIQTLRRRLNSRCKGLLEIGASGGVERVNFLHRTVREYLDRPDIRSKIDSVLHKVQFDSHMELCSAYLSMLKADPEISTDMAQQQRQRDSSLQGCLYWGSKAVGTSQKARLLRLMHSLHKVLKFHPELLPPKTYRDCTVSGSLTIEEHPGMHSFSGDGFLNLVTRFGIVEYLESRVPSGALSRLKCQFFSDDWLWETSLSDRLTLAYITGVTRLSGMIHRGTKSITEGSPLPLLLDACLCFPPNAAVFQCLLEKGADFNQVMRIPLLRLQLVGASHRNAGVTFLTDKASLLAVVVAAAIMTTMNEAYNLREKKRADGMDAWEVWDKWIEVLKVFVEYGAEIDEKLARTVSRGLQDVSLDFKSEKLMWYVLRDIFNNRYRPANWWDLWYDWSSGSEYYTDDSM